FVIFQRSGITNPRASHIRATEERKRQPAFSPLPPRFVIFKLDCAFPIYPKCAEDYSEHGLNISNRRCHRYAPLRFSTPAARLFLHEKDTMKRQSTGNLSSDKFFCKNKSFHQRGVIIIMSESYKRIKIEML
ncbi:MAG: hypothetical protein LBT23_11470, partial [Synergistaceae bacterium]|nr:hypothetical protein [Synergistaceae bacterium]